MFCLADAKHSKERYTTEVDLSFTQEPGTDMSQKLTVIRQSLCIGVDLMWER